MLLCQISDPHIVRAGTLAYGKVDTPRMLERCVQQIDALPVRPDALVVTGDLTDHGTPEEYGVLADLLAPLRLPTYLLAGNHDERRALQAAFPQHAHLRGEHGFVQYTVEDWPVRLVVLDTVVPGADGGALCERRLAWLERTLAASDRPTIVAQHHPPFTTGLQAMDRQNLANPDAEAALLRRHPQVERVICGHYHRPIQARFGGTLASVCPSTAQQLVLDLAPEAEVRLTYEPPGFHLHYWNGREVVTHMGVVGEFPVWTTRD